MICFFSLSVLQKNPKNFGRTQEWSTFLKDSRQENFEPPHDKTNKMACAHSEDSDQPGHPPSLIRVFAVHMKKPWVLTFPLSAQRRLWSDWTDAQADLSLRWAHSHFVGFVIRRLKCSHAVVIAERWLVNRCSRPGQFMNHIRTMARVVYTQTRLSEVVEVVFLGSPPCKALLSSALNQTC